MTDASSTTTRRLFFACTPPSSVRDALHDLQADTLGTAVPKENLHLTLVFIGNVDENRLRCLMARANDIQMRPFKLVLSKRGYFEKPDIAWSGPENAPDALGQLASLLQDEVEACGFNLKHKDFEPHVTLARDAKKLDRYTHDPIEWEVNGFQLLESIPTPNGVRYASLSSWNWSLQDRRDGSR